MEQRTLIAVALRDDGTVSPHAGRALVWVVYDVHPGQAPVEAYSIHLSPPSSLHEWHVTAFPERHPLHSVDVAIAGSAGDGVIRRLGERNTVLLTTTETDPLTAATLYVAGTLPDGLPHDEAECLGDGHQH